MTIQEIIQQLGASQEQLQRARSIVERGELRNLRRTSDGTFFCGECKGPNKLFYLTSARKTPDKRIVLQCNCGSGESPCKHALALLLALTSGRPFAPFAFPDDNRGGLVLAEPPKPASAKPAAKPDQTSSMLDKPLRIDFGGERWFAVELAQDFSLRYTDSESGKQYKTLPKLHADEDAEQAEDAKKQIAGLRKELRASVKSATDTLETALKERQDWSVQDWQPVFLTGTAVMRQAAQGLVWVARAGAQKAQAFRCLEDGSLVLLDGKQLTLPKNARVSLAQPEELDGQWEQVFAQAGIVPLINQLGA